VANNGTKVGCGGIIRNSKGEYILGFSMNLGGKSVITAEFSAIYYSLKLLDEKGFSIIVVDTDSSEALSNMQTGCVSNNPLWAT